MSSRAIDRSPPLHASASASAYPNSSWFVEPIMPEPTILDSSFGLTQKVEKKINSGPATKYLNNQQDKKMDPSHLINQKFDEEDTWENAWWGSSQNRCEIVQTEHKSKGLKTQIQPRGEHNQPSEESSQPQLSFSDRDSLYANALDENVWENEDVQTISHTNLPSTMLLAIAKDREKDVQKNVTVEEEEEDGMGWYYG